MDKFIEKFRKILKHELITGSFYIFLGGLLSSFLAFLLNLYLARNLSYSDYGEYSSLLSLFTLITIPVGSIGIVIVRFATDYFTRSNLDHAAHFYKRNLQFWSGVSIIFFGVFILLTPFVSNFLKINEPLLIILTGAGVSLSYLGLVNPAFLQSLTKFKELSLITILGMLTRVILGVILVQAGLRVLGAVLSLFVMALISIGIGFLLLKDILFHKASGKVEIHLKEIAKYGLPSALSLLFMSSFISSDVLLVKHFFSPQEAGFYAGLSLVGKVVFYFTGPIATVMFPLIVKRDSEGKAHKDLLFLSFLLVFLASAAITIFYFLFPEVTTKIFLGGKEFLNVAKYLGIFGIFLSIYSLINILINFFLSIKKTRVVYFAFLGALTQIILITKFHNNFTQIISSSILSASFLFILLLLYYFRIYGIHNLRK